jgi:hypothetical protein
MASSFINTPHSPDNSFLHNAMPFGGGGLTGVALQGPERSALRSTCSGIRPSRE